MSGFNDRKDAMENRFAHEEQLGFELEAKCSKFFGLWAAGELGLEGGDAETYAKEVVASNLDEPGFDDILRKVRDDFFQKGIEISDHLMHRHLEEALEKARQAMESE